VRTVHVVLDAFADVLRAPVLAAERRPDAIALEGAFYRVHRLALRADHPEDALDNRHALLVHLVVVAGLVVEEAVVRPGARYHLALAGLAHLAAAGPLGCLHPLKLRELVQDAIRELPFRGVVAPVVEGADGRAVLAELLLEEVEVGGLAGETVPVLGEHDGHAAGGHQVPHAVETGPLEARTALPGVQNLLQDLVTLGRCVVPKPLYLLAKAVAALGLLVRRDAGVEDGLLRAVAIRATHQGSDP